MTTCNSRACRAVLTAALALGLCGCVDPQSDLGKLIRGAGASQIEAGLNSIASGLIATVFEVIEPEPENDPPA